jgi:hypothetical protein
MYDIGDPEYQLIPAENIFVKALTMYNLLMATIN